MFVPKGLEGGSSFGGAPYVAPPLPSDLAAMYPPGSMPLGWYGPYQDQNFSSRGHAWIISGNNPDGSSVFFDAYSKLPILLSMSDGTVINYDANGKPSTIIYKGQSYPASQMGLGEMGLSEIGLSEQMIQQEGDIIGTSDEEDVEDFYSSQKRNRKISHSNPWHDYFDKPGKDGKKLNNPWHEAIKSGLGEMGARETMKTTSLKPHSRNPKYRGGMYMRKSSFLSKDQTFQDNLSRYLQPGYPAGTRISDQGNIVGPDGTIYSFDVLGPVHLMGYSHKTGLSGFNWGALAAGLGGAVVGGAIVAASPSLTSGIDSGASAVLGGLKWAGGELVSAPAALFHALTSSGTPTNNSAGVIHQAQLGGFLSPGSVQMGNTITAGHIQQGTLGISPINAPGTTEAGFLGMSGTMTGIVLLAFTGISIILFMRQPRESVAVRRRR